MQDVLEGKSRWYKEGYQAYRSADLIGRMEVHAAAEQFRNRYNNTPIGIDAQHEFIQGWYAARDEFESVFNRISILKRKDK